MKVDVFVLKHVVQPNTAKDAVDYQLLTWLGFSSYAKRKATTQFFFYTKQNTNITVSRIVGKYPSTWQQWKSNLSV
ncbi:hypothetical protein L2E82_33659 [Cichorium intybus]|uniref:Uncharacterized protein n=1 Tax=Cichorium intybus TaxID=13427 RepID=A0ACB9BL19_CICIN|nr:hypothetical protein L2E82_33659 [Cichorium intybus]